MVLFMEEMRPQVLCLAVSCYLPDEAIANLSIPNSVSKYADMIWSHKRAMH